MGQRQTLLSRALARGVACVSLLFWLLLVAPGAAWAHSQLTTTAPIDGDTVATAPGELVLEFNEPVSPPPNGVRLFDARGAQVETGRLTMSEGGTVMTTVLDGQLADGSYVVAWQATSADGHPIRGAFTFAVTAPTSGIDRTGLLATLGPTPDEAGWQIAAAISRWVLYASALIAAGGVAFLLLVHDRVASERATLIRIVTVAAAVAGVASVADYGGQAVLTAGTGAAALANASVLQSILTSGFGASTVTRLAGLVAVGLAVPKLWSRPATAVAAGGALMVIASFSLTGHTAASSPQALVTGANLAHTAAGAAWFGGLVLLLVTLRRRKGHDAVGAATLVARFSALATVAVVAVVIAGSAMAWAEVRAVRALTSTAYGWTLIAKLVLVGLVIAGGAYNNRRLVPAIKARSPGPFREGPWEGLRRVVRLEAAGIVAVLAVTAVLVNVVPARTAAGVSGFFSSRSAMGDYQLEVTVDPNRAGRNELHLYLLAANGQPTDPGDPQDLQVSFALPVQDIGPIERVATPAGPGHWTMAGNEMTFPGQWKLTFTLPVSRFEQLQTEITVPVNG
ncbi:MAG: copper resistance CopC/CopD family protein [Egibacteraceae bacterium]